LPSLSVDQHSAIAVPFVKGPVINAYNARAAWGMARARSHAPQYRIRADLARPLARQPGASLTPEREANADQGPYHPHRPPCPGGDDRRQAFGEDGPGTRGIGTKKFPHTQPHAYAGGRPWEVGERPLIAAVTTLGGPVAERTIRDRLRGGHQEGDLRRGRIDMPRLQAKRGGIGE
jgi:hypothetical protein